jgi:hypothetical protein
MAVITYIPAMPPAEPQSQGLVITQAQVGAPSSSGSLVGVITPVAFLRPDEAGIGLAY